MTDHAKIAECVRKLEWVSNYTSFIKAHVDRIFAAQGWKGRQYAVNPVAGGSFMYGDDPTEPQKDRARRALLAREHFALNGPPDAPPLPLGMGERESLKVGGLPHIVAWYARSLETRNYDLHEHPTFDEFACGVMASEHTPDFIKGDNQLRKLFPPRALRGLGSGLYWDPPHA